MADATILDVNVAMNRRGVIGRRDFLRRSAWKRGGAGHAGSASPTWMAVQADELRKRQMACIVLWMGGAALSQMDTF